MKSHASASSQPPPSAKPLTAAMVGDGQRSRSLAHDAVAERGELPRLGRADGAAISAMSAPATNALSPPPVRMSARTVGVGSERERGARARWSVFALSALSALGRSIVRMASASCRSPAGCSRRPWVQSSGRASVLVEAAAALLAEPAGGDVLAQQRARAVLVVAEPSCSTSAIARHGVEADEVGELERAHRLVDAQLHRRCRCPRRCRGPPAARSRPR